MHKSRRGSMDLATPMLIMTILGGIVLFKLWDRLPTWVGIAGCVVLGLLGLFGLLGLGMPTGMAANAAREEEREESKE